MIANETACDLFGYTDEELCGNNMKVSQLFTMEDGVKQNVLIEQNIDKEGNIVMVSGKVVSRNINFIFKDRTSIISIC